MSSTDTPRRPTRQQREHLENVAAGRSDTFSVHQGVVQRCEHAGWTVAIPGDLRPPFAPARKLTPAGIEVIGRERFEELRPKRHKTPKREPILSDRTPCLCHCAREEHPDDGLCVHAELCDCEGYRPRDYATARYYDAERLNERAATAMVVAGQADAGDPEQVAAAVSALAEVVAQLAQELRQTAQAEVMRARAGAR